VSTENWAEERDRLRALLGDYDSGKITHFDEGDDGAVRPATTDDQVAVIRERLAALEERLGDSDEG
jgi:hypothetical protein